MTMVLQSEGGVVMHFGAEFIDGPIHVTPHAVPNMSGYVKAVCSSDHALMLRYDGTVWAWGGNDYGQLGDGTTMEKSTPIQIPGLENVVGLAVGIYSSYALHSIGTVKSWGYNNTGALGLGLPDTEIHVPTAIPGLSNVVEISANGYHCLARLRDGTVRGWGDSWATPTVVPGVSNVVAISAAINRSNNSLFLLGDGTVRKTVSGSAVLVAGLTNVVAIASGYNHSLALLSNGTVRAWGSNYYGQLGVGTFGDFYSNHVAVSGLSNVVAIAAGHQHSVALRSDSGLNLPPNVYAGGDATVYLPSLADLSGAVNDDGRPNPPGVVTSAWSQVSGPGTVAFGNSSALVTSASFTKPGVYMLRLNAGDGGAVASDTVTITANGLTSDLPGDVNGDGVVNVDDVNIVIQNFGKTQAEP
jgi:hypothetical protein